MRKINLENDFGTTEEERAANPKFPSNKELTLNWVYRVVDSAYQKTGLSSDKRRIYAGIVEKGNQASKGTGTTLDLGEVEYKFITDAFSAAVTLPSEAKWIDQVEKVILATPAVEAE